VLLAAGLSVLAVFGARSAAAQTSPLPQPTPQQLGAPSVPAGYCKQSTLTGPEFMQLLNVIIKHGDLTDIAFLQKTLGTKFSFSYGKKTDGTRDANSLFYTTDQIMGSPIPVTVTILKGKDTQELNGEIADLQFQPNSQAQVSFFMNCLNLTATSFVSLFGPEAWAGWPRFTLGGGGIDLKNPGKNGTKWEIEFGWFYYHSGRPALSQELIYGVNVKEFP
jgi:hypothetical protein